MGKPKSHTHKNVSLTLSGRGKNLRKPKHPSNTTNLLITIYNIGTQKNSDHLEVLEEELSHINWDVFGLCQTLLLEEKTYRAEVRPYAISKYGNTNHHIGVALLVNKKLKNQIIKMKSVSAKVIYLVKS